MNGKAFPVFDCDSHVVEPPEIWEEYVPRNVRSWVKTQFHFHTETDQMTVNGRVIPASRERSVAAEVGWPGWDKKLPHHDAEDAWEALEHMEKRGVPAEVQQKLLGANARRLHGIEPLLVVKERVKDYEPARLPWVPRAR